jgi:hypothetical protein
MRQFSRTVHVGARLPAPGGYTKIVDAGCHRAARHTLDELLEEYLRHQEARRPAPKTLLEDGRRAALIKSGELGRKDIRRLNPQLR